MVNPRTVNAGLIVPLTGADVDTWGEDDVNPNMVSTDGYLCGVQTVSLLSGTVTLTSPAGFVPTPGAGPTQAENRVLRFTGTLSADVSVILPLPGVYIVENRTVQGSSQFVVQLRPSGAGEVIGLPFGSTCTVYNDGTNVRFADLGKAGDMEFWVGVNSLPRWIGNCSKFPYLAADGSNATYNFSDYPQLGPIMGSTFGGNGITTFGIPDMAGRVPLAYDRTGTRITVAGGAGFNGQALGTAGGTQGSTLITANLPAYTPSGTISGGTSLLGYGLDQYQPPGGGAKNAVSVISNVSLGNSVNLNLTGASFNGTAQGGTSAVFSNVMPTQVCGIWVIKT